jgi:site-specific DNA recombinase
LNLANLLNLFILNNLWKSNNALELARGSSLEDQKLHCRKFAEERDWIVPDDYVYIDASKAGTSRAGRDGLNSLIMAAKKKPSPFQMLLVEETSRLARNHWDVLEIVDALALHGVDVYFVDQNLDSRADHFRMMLTLSLMVNKQYLDRLSDKVRRGQKGRVISGLTSGGRCFGYRSVPVEATPCNDAKGRASFLGMKLKVLDAEAETVRRIFEMSASGVTVPAIATKLNAEHGAAAKIGKLNCPWNQSRVRRILRQERYVGIVVWNKMNRVTDPRTGRVKLHANPPADVLRVPAPELRIVTDELWSRVQARLRPRRASSHPLP